jgi:hypothetical protein
MNRVGEPHDRVHLGLPEFLVKMEHEEDEHKRCEGDESRMPW